MSGQLALSVQLATNGCFHDNKHVLHQHAGSVLEVQKTVEVPQIEYIVSRANQHLLKFGMLASLSTPMPPLHT